MEFKYVAAEGCHLSDEEADLYGRHLSSLLPKHNNELTPEIVLEDARAPSSPTHQYFVWDDAAAAHQHRLSQSRELLRWIKFTVVKIEDGKETQSEPVRIFQNITRRAADSLTERRVYVHTKELLSDEEAHVQVVNEAFRQLSAWKRQWETLQELESLFDAIEEAKVKILAEVA